MAAQELTIDELAQRLGMTTRNIREYQALGLLPPPRKRGRSGYYGLDHIARRHDLLPRNIAGELGDIRVGGMEHELGRTPNLHDAPVPHDRDAVGEPQGLEEVVRDEYDGLLQDRRNGAVVLRAGDEQAVVVDE